MMSTIKKYLPLNLRNSMRGLLESLQLVSLKQAVKEQKLQLMYDKLTKIVPDISTQYSSFFIMEGEFLLTKVRSLHSFQMSLVEKALQILNFKGHETIVDIGDSAGTHVQYFKNLFGDYHTLSVDLDKNAVDKIKGKGLEAVHARAEELDQHNIEADLFLSFEMLEHLSSPITFLRGLAENSSCQGFLVTVPYLSQGRVALNHIRRNQKKAVYGGNTHIFELSPRDWRLIFKHSGWRIKYEQIFLQYPQRNWTRLTKKIWGKIDFEGFYGAILVRDDSWSSCYQDW